MLAAAVLLAVFDGGYVETAWYPVALFVLALLVLVLVVAPPARVDRSRAFDAAIVCLGLFTAWSYLSMLWAAVPGDAWEGANRTLLYWLTLTVVGLRPWSLRAATAGIGVAVAGVTALAVGMLIATTGSDPERLFLEGRLSDPTGYANATANLWLIAVWPALHLALAREVRWWLRGLALGSATLLAEVALLSQSRGAVLAFGLTAIVFVCLHPRRWPAVVAVAVLVAFVVAGWSTLVDVRNVRTSAMLEDALRDARVLVLVSTVLAAAAGGAVALLLGRRPAPERLRRTGDRLFAGLAGAAAVTAIVVVAASPGWVDDRWQDFKTTGYEHVESGSTRFSGSLGSSRYDFYRVALKEFADQPLHGLGADNFQVAYLEHRRTGEAPRYPHSLAFSVLEQLGVVGALLFAGFLAAAAFAFTRVRRGGTPAEQGLATAALAGFAMWFFHAQVDWIWEYGALSMLALGLLAIACRTGSGAGEIADAPGWPLSSVPARAAVVVIALAAAVSLVLPAAAARFERSAYAVQRTDPALTLTRLDRAADLDPLSAGPLVGAAVIARTNGQAEHARDFLRRALEREPDNWFAHFEAGLVHATQRRWASAARELARAHALNPRQPVIADVQDAVRTRSPVDAAAAERALSEQLSVRLRPLDAG